jgi:hypothetical protein
MTHPKKELAVACSYLLRLIKPHVELSAEQIHVFKRTFHDILSKRFVGHWFPGKDDDKHVGKEGSKVVLCRHPAPWKCLSMSANQALERSSAQIHRRTFFSAVASIFTNHIHHVDW